MMMLMRLTNASINVMYALAAVIPPPGLKLLTDCPPPETTARSSSYDKRRIQYTVFGFSEESALI